MLDVIESQYADVVTLRMLSATIGRQPAYLGRLFRQEVGASVREYLTRVRLGHAAELIGQGVKIEAVALSVGYRSKKNFYQRFKNQYGTTPLPYRNRGATAAEPGGRQADETPRGFRAEDTTPSAAGSSRRRQRLGTDPITSDPEPILASLGSVARASNRAWRLAVRVQERMLQHFSPLCLGMFLTNDDGRYIAANSAALSATGYSTAELAALSPADLFVSTAIVEARRAWQLLVVSPRDHQKPNAMLRTKSGDSIAVHVVTLRNLLWGRREMLAMLERLRPTG